MVASTGPLEYPNAIGDQVRTCKPCGIAKPPSEFYNNRSTSDGKSPYCKDCTKSHMREQAVKHAARIAAYESANRDTRRAKKRAKYAENADRERARVRDYRARNPEKVKQQNRNWSLNNPEHDRLRQSLRRARQRELPTYVITDKDMRRLYSSPCSVDGCSATNIEADHVVPIVRGGSHGIANLQPLCRSHNAMKRHRLWIEFRAYLALRASALVA